MIEEKKPHGNKGRPRSEETRAKISASKMGSKRPDEVKAKISATKKGKKLSEEHRRAISEGHLKKNKDKSEG